MRNRCSRGRRPVAWICDSSWMHLPRRSWSRGEWSPASPGRSCHYRRRSRPLCRLCRCSKSLSPATRRNRGRRGLLWRSHVIPFAFGFEASTDILDGTDVPTAGEVFAFSDRTRGRLIVRCTLQDTWKRAVRWASSGGRGKISVASRTPSRMGIMTLGSHTTSYMLVRSLIAFRNRVHPILYLAPKPPAGRLIIGEGLVGLRIGGYLSPIVQHWN